MTRAAKPRLCGLQFPEISGRLGLGVVTHLMIAHQTRPASNGNPVQGLVYSAGSRSNTRHGDGI